MESLPPPSLRVTFLIKADLPDPDANVFVFENQKTIYGGKGVAVGDTIFVFASAAKGSQDAEGLCALGRVMAVSVQPRIPGALRQTPRISISVQGVARPRRRVGRKELRPFSDWQDGRPETELNFKFYRQATHKLGGISASAAEFLWTFF